MNRRPLAIARLLLTTHLPYLMLMWVAYALVVLLLIGAVALFRSITISGWDVAGAVVRWFALGYGFYLTGRLLPVYLAHGQTRRAFMAQVTVYTAVAAPVLAALMTIGYQLERLLYTAMDWPQKMSSARLFTAGDEVGPIYVTYVVVLLVWTVAGALLSAAFYRFEAGGVLAIPVALALVALSGTAIGFDKLLFIDGLLEPVDAPLTVALVIGVATYLVGTALTWLVVRDMPLRNRTA